MQSYSGNPNLIIHNNLCFFYFNIILCGKHDKITEKKENSSYCISIMTHRCSLQSVNDVSRADRIFPLILEFEFLQDMLRVVLDVVMYFHRRKHPVLGKTSSEICFKNSIWTLTSVLRLLNHLRMLQIFKNSQEFRGNLIWSGIIIHFSIDWLFPDFFNRKCLKSRIWSNFTLNFCLNLFFFSIN